MEISSTKCAPQMMEGNQQSFNTNTLIPTMNEGENSLTMWVQYTISAKYSAENNAQEAFEAAENFLQITGFKKWWQTSFQMWNL